MDELTIILIYNKEDDNLLEINKIIFEEFLKDKTELPVESVAMNVKSSKFTEQRTANSLLRQHGTTKTPLLLFRKKGVSVRAIYSEEIKAISDYNALLPKRFEEAKGIEVTIVEEEVFE